MRIIINIDPIREKGKRMRIRTRYQLGHKDGAAHVQVTNALVDFYNDTVQTMRDGIDPAITDFIDEGERI